MSVPDHTTDIDISAVEPTKPRRLGFLSTAGAVLVGIALLMTGYTVGVQAHDPTRDSSAAGSAALSSDELAKRIEADGVEIVYTADPDLNCAAEPSATGGEAGRGGCVYMGTTPERIYISPDLEEPKHVYVLIHEYAHILQARGAWPVGGASATGMGGLDSECWADIYASSEGVPYAQLHYLPTCEIPGAMSSPPAT